MSASAKTVRPSSSASPSSFPSLSRRWLLVALSCVEVLTATGIIFGWSSLALQLRREGAYDELCDAGQSGCKKQVLRLSGVYTAGAAAIPVSGMVWGPLLDIKGAMVCRRLGLGIFSIACLFFAFADSKTFDVYILAAALLSVGGMGFFLSHFVIAEHFASDHFGLVHSLINCAFDSSTATFTVMELLHGAGATTRGLFLGLASLAVLYLALSTEHVWAGHLSPPPRGVDAGGVPAPAIADKGASAGEGEDKGAVEATVAARSSPQFGPLLDESGRSFGAQLRSAPFIALGVWSLFTIYRTMFILGSINEQMIANGGGRTVSQAESLVRVFNLLILVSTILTPPFGRFVDKYGMVPAFLLVNALGIFTYGALLARPDWALYLAFLAFGCFRAWNYSLLTTYVQGVFGGESFGKVYGIGVGMFSIVSATTQYPTMELVMQKGESGSFVEIDLIFVGFGVLLFSFPAFVHMRLVMGRRRPNGEGDAV
mmetsp:Transcript_29246/g.46943  ORF Transcript_29246/g.46943 Transcript_29246/m.46943 type:complete len:485 (-) Transcript_29246:410-1864(-)|eukprot:CAMPEP_0198703678 /NCGR_PEP_ID=MMETSP1468-20131203/389480_1 /TAXON_ID=1461545 /ORGANISM="Mantoniella sp, Strain CCMP1436" /LENGTH=484 /DNA_ID=CAMNT_0044462411 /DNA_START=310 /DNA_END=1764 /DNA_ORIENTATION=+